MACETFWDAVRIYGHESSAVCRYADKLEAAHDAEHLAKFEELLEAAVDLDRIPDEYLICASYDADLQVHYRPFLPASV